MVALPPGEHCRVRRVQSRKRDPLEPGTDSLPARPPARLLPPSLPACLPWGWPSAGAHGRRPWQAGPPSTHKELLSPHSWWPRQELCIYSPNKLHMEK